MVDLTKQYIRLLLLFALALVGYLNAQSQRPNIIYIVTDDMGGAAVL